MKTVTLTYQINIHADQKTVFEYVADWEKQSDWILFTTVHITAIKERPQDVTLLATTKLGVFKLVDTMVITDWQPCDKIVVEHTGRIVLGKGVFSVQKQPDNSSTFIWQEITPVPFGLVGQLGLFIARPFLKLLFGMSLKKLKLNIESSSR